MKKIVFIAASLMLLASPVANAQSILGRLAEKAGQAVSSKISEKVTEKVTEKVSEKVSETVSEKLGVDVASAGKSLPGGVSVPDGKETLQPRRSSTFGWDGVVTPSDAKFPIPLMNEFPAVPDPSKLASPTEEDQIAYYRAIKAVTLRAEELNADTTCEDEFAEKWRAELEQALMQAYGLTLEEYNALKDGTMTEAEQEKLAERIKSNLLGGMSEEQILAEAEKAEKISPDSTPQERALEATGAVYDKHAAELPKYTGCTAEDFKRASRESMYSDDNAATRAIEKKSEAYMKSLSPEMQKEVKAFMNVLKKELMNAALDSTPGARAGLGMATNIARATQQLSPILEKYQKMEKYAQDIYAAWPKNTWSDSDARFSAADRKKVESIKSEIYATESPAQYNALYLQALEVIKTYRERAAKAWAADVQKRYDGVKNSMGDVIKIQRQAVEDGVIPECALWRVPLNLVVIAGDVLAEAYSEFPCNYPAMYDTEVVRQLKLQDGEKAWWPEFYVSSDLENVLAGKNIFKEGADGKVYQFNKGSWLPVPDDFEAQAAPKASKPVSASFKSSDGMREVSYNAEGGFLSFPEGDIVYPMAWEKQGNAIVWADVSAALQEDGSIVYQIAKCTYKL